MRVLAVLVAVALAGCQDRAAPEEADPQRKPGVAEEVRTALEEAMKSEDYTKAEAIYQSFGK